MSIPSLPQDKANHFFYGALIAAALVPLVGYEAACWVVLAIGIAKEVVDEVLNLRAASLGLPPPHGVEALDVIATSAGALTVSLPYWVSEVCKANQRC